jgi:hypothetical protein
MKIEDCILELPELSYDKSKLNDIFETVKSYARVKSLPWIIPTTAQDAATARNVVIQSHDYMIMNNEDHGKGTSLLAIPYIREIMDKLNFEIIDPHLDIMWNRPGFKFFPHTDGWAKSVFVWPIFSDGDYNPIDFYNYEDDVIINKEYKNLTSGDIFYTHHYSDCYPTVFNSHLIHGVDLVKNHRIFLRLRSDIPFSELRKKYHDKTLFKNL